MNYFIIALLCSLCILITACGPVHNRSTEYVTAQNDPEIKLPADLSNEKLNNYYPIPNIPKQEASTTVVPAELTPPGLTEAEQAAEQWKKQQKQHKSTK